MSGIERALERAMPRSRATEPFRCVVVGVLIASACGTNGPAARERLAPASTNIAPDGGRFDDAARADAASLDPSGVDAGPTYGCTGLPTVCRAWNVRATCVATPNGPSWLEETCAGGCFAGACVTDRCADECVLGATSPAGTCRLFDLASRKAIDVAPATSMLDRARDYDRWLAHYDLRHGFVFDVAFTDATRTTVATYGGGGDAAIWTGSALAAVAWRARATGAPEAHAQLAAYVSAVHRAFSVSAEPGFLARLVVPTSTPEPIEVRDCASTRWHCGVPFEGQLVDWMGDTSRDQYTGVMLGYAAAYFAAADEGVRETIRNDVVTTVLELMKSRDVPIHAELSISGVPVQLDKTVTIEHAILSPSEMVGGKVFMSGNPASGGGELRGMREFMPDLSPLVKQLTGIGLPVPRASSAMMLGAFFRMALAMTENVPARAQERQRIADYYAQRANGWLDTAALWALENKDCDDTYYPNHIAFVMAYVWALLEDDPTFRPRIRDEVLHGRMWTALANDKNPYFAFLWAGARSLGPTDVASDRAQLAQFPVGPRVHLTRDWSNDARYPALAGCTQPPMSSVAIDVGDRHASDFMWQRSPRVLVDGGDGRVVFPGVDYLAAYWAGRHHGLLEDDHPGTCTRFLP